MQLKKRWLWEAYVLILLIFLLRRAWNFFSPTSPVYFYFSLLKAFDFSYILLQAINACQLFLSFVHLFPLTFYIYRIYIFSPQFWQYLFILRIISDVVGNSYEINILVSFYHEDPLLGLTVLAQSISTYIPSYIACYLYAFKWKRLPSNDGKTSDANHRK